jgi:hypothetical protein
MIAKITNQNFKLRCNEKDTFFNASAFNKMNYTAVILSSFNPTNLSPDE